MLRFSFLHFLTEHVTRFFFSTPEVAYPVFAGTLLDYDGEERVLVNNKCKCTTVTSRLVPSKENPDEEILERNIRIT